MVYISARTLDRTRKPPVTITKGGMSRSSINVKKNAAELTRMSFSKGRRAVPVIVDDGEVTIGFGGT
jgi:hypothetical protein